MMVFPKNLPDLRRTILETLRVQRGGPETIPYIDVGHTLSDIAARQNHAVFGRRGCGKTLLLHHAPRRAPSDVRRVYVNCEDFKKHSFPDVLIEILDAVFKELDEKQRAWFGRKKQLKEVMAEIRRKLSERARRRMSAIKRFARRPRPNPRRQGERPFLAVWRRQRPASACRWAPSLSKHRDAVEREYKQHDSKAKRLNVWLPQLKDNVREFFALSTDVQAVYLQIDDFYHLRRTDQPHVMDYVHRLCKDLPFYFKIATLRHASVLYADRQGQPTGAQAGMITSQSTWILRSKTSRRQKGNSARYCTSLLAYPA